MPSIGVTLPVMGAIYIALIGTSCRLHASKKFRKRYAFFKILTSLCFVGMAVYAGIHTGGTHLFLFLLPGFWFALIGDYLLGLAHAERNYKGVPFLLGAMAFMLAHISFYLALCAEFSFYIMELVVPALFTVILSFVIRGENFDLGKMRIPGLIYSFFVALLSSKGLSLLIVYGCSAGAWLVFSGGLFFLISDIILLFMYFHVGSSKKGMGALNLVTYYLAMGLLAYSILVL